MNVPRRTKDNDGKTGGLCRARLAQMGLACLVLHSHETAAAFPGQHCRCLPAKGLLLEAGTCQVPCGTRQCSPAGGTSDTQMSWVLAILHKQHGWKSSVTTMHCNQDEGLFMSSQTLRKSSSWRFLRFSVRKTLSPYLQSCMCADTL